MNLELDTKQTAEYTSNSQKARVLTETWTLNNVYCPRCGNPHISKFENNRPVADFFCPVCSSEYELKSKQGSWGKKITDGAYDTMIKRILEDNAPDFLLASYSIKNAYIYNLLFISKRFFTPKIIEKRKPLSNTSRRAGWVGCNILIDEIPIQGRIAIVDNSKIVSKINVIKKVQKGDMMNIGDMDSRGWIFDVLNCVNKTSNEIFLLSDIYACEEWLAERHPGNNNIKAKIRQQLQFLRDKGYIEFLGKGVYRKLQ